MASTFDNDLRLEEMATGENAGSWGTKTNTNLELIADAFGYGTFTIADADTTLEIPEGSGTDNALRSMYLKISSSADLTTTRVLTLAPNTINKLWFIENNTSGGQTITISQGSGANVSILNGQAKLVATDGAGAGAAVIDATQDLAIPDLFVDSDLTVGNDLIVSADLTVDTDTLYVDSTNDRVGVNKSSPSAPLVVNHPGTTGTDEDIVRFETQSGGDLKFQASDLASANPAWRMYTPGGEEIIFGTNDTNVLRINTSQRVLIGLDSAIAVGSTSSAGLQVASTGTNSWISQTRFNNANAGPLHLFGKSRSTTVGTFGTVVQDDDALGTLSWAGDDGTDAVSVAAQIQGAVDGTPGANDMPGRLVFFTTADGAAAPTERMRITNNGRVGINTASESGAPLGWLTIDNDINSADVLTNKASYHIVVGVDGGHTDNYIGGIGFGDVVRSDIQAAISAVDNGTSAATGIAFATGNTSSVLEAMRINSGQRVLVGQKDARNSFFNNNVGTYNPRFQIESSNTTGGIRMASFVHNDDANNAFCLVLGKSGGTTAGSLSTIVQNHTFGLLSFQGATGNAIAEGARIQGVSDGAPGASDMPGRIEFKTTPDGSASSVERMRIANDGTVIVYESIDIQGATITLGEDAGFGSQSKTVIHSQYGGIANDALVLQNNTATINGRGVGFQFKATGGAMAGINSARTSDSDATKSNTTFYVTDGQLRLQTNSTLGATIDDSANFLVGTTTVDTNFSGPGVLQVAGQNSAPILSVSRYQANSAGAYLRIGKSRATSAGSRGVVSNGDGVGYLQWVADDGSDLNKGVAQISAEIDGSPGSGDLPGRLMFFTTPDGGSSAVERMRIKASGDIEMITPNSGVGLYINNTTHDSIVQIQTSGANKNSTLRFADGDDADVGMIDYDHANNSMQFTANASERARITSDGVLQTTQFALGNLGGDAPGFMMTKITSASTLTFDFVVDVDTGSWTPLNFYISIGSISSGAAKPRASYFVMRGATYNGSLGSLSEAGTIGDTSDITVTISDQGGTDPMTVRVTIGHPNNRVQATVLAMGYLGIRSGS